MPPSSEPQLYRLVPKQPAPREREVELFNRLTVCDVCEEKHLEPSCVYLYYYSCTPLEVSPPSLPVASDTSSIKSA